MPRENLLSLFREFETYRGDIAVIQKRGYRRETWTYGSLSTSAKSCAVALKQLGVKTGDRVLLWAPNSAEWLAVFWACLLRGAVVVPMDDGGSPDFVTRVARDAGTRVVLTTRERALATPRIFDGATQVIDLDEFVGSAGRSSGHEDCESFSDVPLTRSHVAQILFTSGTTSEPRGVVLTHGNFLANLEPLETGIASYRKYERWFHPLRFVTLVPLSHVFGQFMALLVPPLLGAGVVFESSANPAEITRTIKRQRATALIAVPRMIESLRTGIEREMASRGHRDWLARTLKAAEGRKFLRRAWMFRRIHRRLGWKFWAFISGGAALATRDEEFFKRLGYAVVQGYGMTETASLISLNHPFRATEGSIGKVLPGREFRLAADGEILVRGENVSAGYWEAGALRRKEATDWLHTGDVGELDAQGNLRFRGRKKNVLVTPAGLNIYPEDLEGALRKQPAIRDCVVFPIERDGNSQPCAVLLLNANESSQSFCENIAGAAIAGANSTLAEYQRIHNWVVWPEVDFPRTSTGKPRLSIISARAAEILSGNADLDAASRNPSRLANFSESLDQLVQRFTPHSAVQSSSPHALERDLSLTSLDRVELMSALEEKFHLELDETAFSNAKTVTDIQILLKQPSAQRTQYSYPAWAQTSPIHAARLIIYYLLVWPATVVLAHPKVIGRENLRSSRGPILVVSNHVTRRSDIGLILKALPRRYRHNLATAMGGETLQNMRHPPRRVFLKRWACQLGYWLVTALFNVFPLPQRSGFRESFRFAGESVDRGYSILVFPEGEVTSDGSMASFQAGIGLLAENLGLPCVPMRMDGVSQMKREHRRLAHRGEITVRIGAPVRFPPGTDPAHIAKTLQNLVQSL
jgi:long-chain acyl-CoA synthetase